MGQFRSQAGPISASGVPSSASGNLAATTTQAALVELQGDIDGIQSVPPSTSNPLGFQGSSALQAINQTHYIRVSQGAQAACSKVRLYIGASSGNICVAVYANTGASPVTRVATSGSVASPGTGVREITISPAVDIVPGMWLSVSADNTSVTFGRGAAPGLLANAMGTGFQYYENVYPAPATAAPANPSFYNQYILIGAA